MRLSSSSNESLVCQNRLPRPSRLWLSDLVGEMESWMADRALSAVGQGQRSVGFYSNCQMSSLAPAACSKQATCARGDNSLSKLLRSMKLPLSLLVLFFLPNLLANPPLFAELPLLLLLLPPTAPPAHRKTVARKRAATDPHIHPKLYLPSEADLPAP